MPKITELTGATALASTDLLLLVNDPSGAPVTKKIVASAAELAFANVHHFAVGGALADDATTNLPAVTTSGIGIMVAGDDDERAIFSIKANGTVNLLVASSNVVANANTDGKVCIGTSVASPCVIKNRLGSSKSILVVLDYD